MYKIFSMTRKAVRKLWPKKHNRLANIDQYGPAVLRKEKVKPGTTAIRDCTAAVNKKKAKRVHYMW